MKIKSEKNKELNQLLKDNEVKKAALYKIIKKLNTYTKTKISYL